MATRWENNWNNERLYFGLVAKSCPTLVALWTVARQAPLSMGFSRQGYWSELPFPSPGNLPDPGIEPRSPALQADSLPTELWGKPRLYFGGSKISANGDCTHEIKRCFKKNRCLLLTRKAMTKLESMLKSRDITLPTKVRLVKAVAFPVVMYRCESWSIKKAERRRIDAFELWWWRRLLRVPWTARRSNQSILKEINP